MTRSYCTLADKNYLYQVLALHNSLLRHGGDVLLYVLCMDSTTNELLTKMNTRTMVPIRVDELLTLDVITIRKRTTHGQFCWVCQPLLCEYVLDRFSVEMVTYLEADSLFFSNPEVLFVELDKETVSLVPHNYSPEFDNVSTAGTFCVQFNSFGNSMDAREVLAYWKEWNFKYNRSRPTAYPGQTSLDDWPEKFRCVKVIENRGAGVAPWNVLGYEVTVKDEVPHVNGAPVVFYHFHEYGRYANGDHELGQYPFTPVVIDIFYRAYVNELRRAEEQVMAVDESFKYRREYASLPSFAEAVRSMSTETWRAYGNVQKRKARGRFHVYGDGLFPPSSSKCGGPRYR